MTQAIPGPQGCVLPLTAHSCQTGMLRHKIIGRLSKLKTGDGSEQRDLRLVVEVIIHTGAYISRFVGAVYQTLACYEALKMTGHKLNSFGVKLFRRFDNCKRVRNTATAWNTATHAETHFVKFLVLGAALWYYGCTSHKGEME